MKHIHELAQVVLHEGTNAMYCDCKNFYASDVRSKAARKFWKKDQATDSHLPSR